MTTEELNDFASALTTLQGILEAMESRGELDLNAKRHLKTSIHSLKAFHQSHRFISARSEVEEN